MPNTISRRERSPSQMSGMCILACGHSLCLPRANRVRTFIAKMLDDALPTIQFALSPPGWRSRTRGCPKWCDAAKPYVVLEARHRRRCWKVRVSIHDTFDTARRSSRLSPQSVTSLMAKASALLTFFRGTVFAYSLVRTWRSAND
jgi:hypothetical protein